MISRRLPCTASWMLGDPVPTVVRGEAARLAVDRASSKTSRSVLNFTVVEFLFLVVIYKSSSGSNAVDCGKLIIGPGQGRFI